MKTYMKIDLIIDYLNQNKISKTEFCKRAGISVNVLNKILADKRNVRLDKVIKVFNIIGAKSIFNC